MRLTRLSALIVSLSVASALVATGCATPRHGAMARAHRSPRNAGPSGPVGPAAAYATATPPVIEVPIASPVSHETPADDDQVVRAANMATAPNAATSANVAVAANAANGLAAPYPVVPAGHHGAVYSTSRGWSRNTRGGGAAALPGGAFTGGPAMDVEGCPPDFEGQGPTGPWQPDGLYGPYPYDEYIFDGGDRDIPVKVAPDWTVRGLDQEDTVAHYDTLRGRVEVAPSNRVPIYAPRFAAVRRIDGVEYNEGHERVAGTENPTRLNSQEATRLVTTAVQPTQPVLQHAFRSSVAFRDQTRGIGLENSQRLAGFDNRFLPYEDFLLIRRGQFDSSEKARLAQRVQAALVWTKDQSVQVVLDGDPAIETVGSSKPQETVEYHMPEGKARLRIVKVASQSEAQPGEEIEFTLRFDNVGNERIGNVTIVDSLTTRLEYVEGSAQCSLKANFATQENEAESHVLRWEIVDPLDVAKGGIIRFKCKVR